MSRIVLCGIVRNEERTIERMLRSASDVLGGSLSAVLLADTGSTDATVATAERVCAEIAARHPLHAEVRSHPWEDFGANRTRVLAEACALGADFALMLDADETLVGRAPTEPLVEDAYMVEVRGDGSASYWLPLLVSAGRSWHYTGVTHEALAETGRFPRIESFGIVHHHDGANRATKFERDRELLEAELARDPQHARSVFYLARTYWCMGDFERATDLFDRRAAMGGWPEEAFFARYQAALVRRSIEGLLAAWELFPQRGEPLYQALRLLRERRMWQTAYALALRGLELTEAPLDHLLFTEPWLYDWGLRFEYSIVCWWTGRHDICRQISLELLARNDLPDAFRTAAERNLALCATGDTAEAV